MSDSPFLPHFHAHQRVVQSSLEALQAPAEQVADVLIAALQEGGKVLAFGNGGSAAQASHFVAELLGRFAQTRRPLPAVALTADASAVTCISNDFGYDELFQRQIQALVQTSDVALALTTSGRSANVLRGLAAARRRGATTVALIGADEQEEHVADHVLAVPSTVPARVQEVHLLLLHTWCAAIDAVLAI